LHGINGMLAKIAHYPSSAQLAKQFISFMIEKK